MIYIFNIVVLNNFFSLITATSITGWKSSTAVDVVTSCRLTSSITASTDAIRYIMLHIIKHIRYTCNKHLWLLLNANIDFISLNIIVYVKWSRINLCYFKLIILFIINIFGVIRYRREAEFINTHYIDMFNS